MICLVWASMSVRLWSSSTRAFEPRLGLLDRLLGFLLGLPAPRLCALLGELGRAALRPAPESGGARAGCAG